MKRLGGVWPRLIAFPNLLEAHRRAARGKRGRPDAQQFILALEQNLFALQRERDACTEYLAGLRLRPHPDNSVRLPSTAKAGT